MSEWKIKKLSEVADIIGGGTPSSKENAYYDNGTIPWITPKDLSNYNEMYISNGERNITELGLKNSSAKLLPKGSILFSSRAPIGYVAIANKELSTNQGFKSLVLKEGHVPEFYYYLLKQNVALFEARASGTTFKEVSGQIVKDTELSIPDKETQGKIVSILKPLDDKIQLNTKTNKTLEAIAQAIFKHWFIDFAPVHAKAEALAEGKTAGQAELAAMASVSGKTEQQVAELAQTNPQAYQQLQQTAAAFPSEFVESELGLVPKGWEEKKIEDFGKIICGKTPAKNNIDFYGEDIPFIKIPDMHNNIFIINTSDNLSRLGANNQNNKFIEKGSICVSCIATVGLVAIASKRSQTNQQINSIIPISKNMTEYLYLLFSQDSMKIYLKDLASGGSATLNLNTGMFSKIKILKPSENLLNSFHERVNCLFSKILLNQEMNQTLAQTRDSLLPKLLSGEIGL